MEEDYINIGKIDLEKIKEYKGKVITADTILTFERINNHICISHKEEYEQLKKYIAEIVENPDYIIKDNSHEDTLIFLKHVEEINKKARIVIKLATNKEDIVYNKNSIITIMRQRDKSWQQTLKNRGKIIYKKLDKKE